MKGRETMKTVGWVLAVLLGLSPLLQAAETEKSPMVLFQEALYQEETEGDLNKAIELYQQVLDEAAEVRFLAARSLYQLGMCHLKKGEKDAAAGYFKKVVNEYPKQTSIIRKSEKQLEKFKPADPLKDRPFIVWFKAKNSSGISNAKGLLDAFNKKHPKNVETFRFRTETEDGQLIGGICVGNGDSKDKLVKMLEKHDKLEFIKTVPAYTIVFRAKGSKQIDDSDLLKLFNEKQPKDVSTYRYQTVKKNGICEGALSTDTTVEKDKLVQMIQSNDKLELVQVIGGETSGGLYDQATPAVWMAIGSLYSQACTKAGAKNLYTNSNIHFVNSDFDSWYGGYGYYTNTTQEPISGRVQIGQISFPNVKHYDIMGNRLTTEIVSVENEKGLYQIYLDLPQALAPGQFYPYAWAVDGSKKTPLVPFSKDKYLLKMENHLGIRAFEVFYIFFTNDLEVEYKWDDKQIVKDDGSVVTVEREKQSKQTVGDFTIYAWEREVRPKDNHVVMVNLSKQENVAIAEELPVEVLEVNNQIINKEYIKNLLGQPQEEQEKGLNYQEKYGIDFYVDGYLQEIRLNSSFKGKLSNGLSMQSSIEDVFKILGQPKRTESTGNLTNKFEDRVLYRSGNYGKIIYESQKLLFWFKDDQITQIVLHGGSLKGTPIVKEVPLELSTLPFFDGETMRLKLSTPAGMDIGQIIWQCRSIEKDGVFYDRIESYMHIGVQNFQQYTAVDAKRNSFLPIRGLTKNEMGIFEADYSKDTITLKSTVNGNETTRDFTIPGQIFDNEQALYVIRSLPLEVGYETEFDIFPVQSGSSAQCRIRVPDIQTIPWAGGEIECYAIKLAVYSGGIKALEHDLWISTDEHRWLVKYDSGQIVMELISAGKHDLDQPEQISEHGITYGFEIPAGWEYIHSSIPQYKVSVQILPPELTVWAGLYGIEKTGLSESIKTIAEGDIEILKGFFKNYMVRSESWQKQQINGADSASYIADYEDKGQQMVEYRTYIMADSLIYWFVFRVEKDLFETKKAVLDSIVNSFNPKALGPKAKEWVENFFKHNYRDITHRKTLEWGEPTTDENGNISIRYKYEATIWDKDKKIDNHIFTFDKDGKFISVVDAEANPLKAENLIAEGWQLWQQRKLAEAESKFQQAIRSNPKSDGAWQGLGWAQFNQGKSKNAEVAFKKCVKLNPENSAALNGLGWIEHGQGNMDKAIKWWEKAVKASNGVATASLSGLTQVYMEQQEYGKAVKYYEMWLKAEPNNQNAKDGLEKAKQAMKQ